MTTLLRDLRLGVRMLGKHRGTTIIAVTALSLGIGLTTTMFSVIKGHALAGLPFDNPDQLVSLGRSNLSEGRERMGVSVHDFLDWRQATSFEGMSAWNRATFNLSDEERPERHQGAFVHAELFDMLRVPPLLGRTLQANDGRPGAPPVLVINAGVWESQFGGDPGIIGKTVRANGTTATIVGVMPEWFEFPVEEVVWAPFVLETGAVRGDSALFTSPLSSGAGGRAHSVFARVRDGVELDQAFAELAGIATRLELEYPATNQGVQPLMQPFVRQFIGERFIQLNFIMMAAVFAVLLIACANVANILLVRAAGRSKEIAIRTALGASRAEVIAQLLTETFIFAAIGGVLGIGLSYIGVALYKASIQTGRPHLSGSTSPSTGQPSSSYWR